MKFAIVGGGGYIGFHIAVDLVRKDHEVILVDVREPDEEWVQDSGYKIGKDEKLKFAKGNVLNVAELESAFQFIDCVIHCASYGMSGKEMMPSYWDKTESINVTGTVNVINACSACGVGALVYTSTFNVVFGGQEIHNGNETLPYFPLHRHVDHYSRTKSVAEQLVLMADRKMSLDGKKMLRSCALRLAGVMGLKEQRHLPRIVSSLKMLKFRYGYGQSLVQFCDIANVVQAHVKAAMGILEKPEVVGGQAYFISDEEPINNLEFFRPLIEKLGYTFPTLTVPMWLMWAVAFLLQFFHSLLIKLFPSTDFVPLITPAEIYKTAVTHYFSSEKATEHFGYKANNPNNITDAAEYFYAKSKQKPKKSNSFFPLSLLVIATLICAIILLRYF